MSVALLVVTDGRDDYLGHCVKSLDQLQGGPITERWMYDDTGDEAYREQLARQYPDFLHINGGPRQGFGGAIRTAWDNLMRRSGAAWVFHIEQDFVFTRPVDLSAMADVMHNRPHLAQIALRRQPWNTLEQAAGGVVEMDPGSYRDCIDNQGRAWLEHRIVFTSNPCLYRRSLTGIGWPASDRSEGRFTHQLLARGTPEAPGPLVRFAYWGARDSGVWVEHIGHRRHGKGY